MDGYTEQALLDDQDAFHPYGNIYGIELWRSTNLSKPFFRHGDIGQDQYLKWLHQQGQYAHPVSQVRDTRAQCLRILVCKSTEALRNWRHNGVPGSGAPAMSMSRAEYEEALQCMKLPRNLLTIMSRQTAAWTRNPEGFVLKTSSSRTWHFGMACSHSSSDLVVNVLLLGLEEAQLAAVCQCLEVEDMSLPLPALLPILLVELRAQATLHHISHSHTNIFFLEGDTGVFSDKWRDDPPRELGFRLTPSGAKVLPRVRKSVDYEKVTVDLTGTITELSHALFTCEVNTRLLEDLTYLIGTDVWDVPSTEKKSDYHANLTDKVAYLRTYYAGLESRANYVMRRAQAQVQTVYSMVAQRDSAASTTLAEASRQDNILMRKIAEDSKRVAIATSRDSASMKVIAGVTILFLPATFVATLFSTSFFNFEQPGKVVSWWLWLYWTVTVILTVAIHGAWYMMSRNKEKEIEQRFGDRFEDEQVDIHTQQTK